jgi:hypothetical protein
MTPETSYREIPLSQGKVALVSAHRFEYLSQFKWSAMLTKGETAEKWYAVRSTSTKNGQKRRTILMHRDILGILDTDDHGDHVNGDGLDNRDENLRRASVSQNQMNRAASDSRGVRLHRGRWHARIKIDRREIYLGSFETEIEARIAYAEAAEKMHGEFRHHSVLQS